MNGVLLPVIFIVLAVFGYFTVGRWLQRSVFALPPRPPTDPERVSVPPFIALADHAGTVPGLLTLGSVVIGLYWGWTPAFVWILVGTTVFGLVYFLGNRYWSNFVSPEAPLAPYKETGSRVTACGHGLILATLLATSAMLLVLVVLLMPGHPELVIALGMAYPAYWCFKRSSLASGWISIPGIAWTFSSLACLALGVVFAAIASTALEAHLYAEAPSFLVQLFTSPLPWSVLILAGFTVTVFRSSGSTETPGSSFGVFSGQLFLLLLLVLGVGLVFENPNLELPTHTADSSIPSFLSLFLLIFVGGVMSAARGIVSLERSYLEGAAPRHGLHYTGYLLDAVFAVLVMGIVAGYNGAGAEISTFESWPAQPDFRALLEHASAAIAGSLAVPGLSRDIVTVTILLILQLIALSFAIHLLRTSSRMLEQSGLAAVVKIEVRPYIPSGVVAFLVLLVSANGLKFGAWIALGLLNALTIGVLMLYVTWTLIRNQKPSVPPLILAVFLSFAAISQGVMTLPGRLANGEWLEALVAVLILVAAIFPMSTILRLTVPELGRGRSALDLFDRE